ncbi:MAG TPA: prepilin-type N-terminal cleavage/methylation domain-containing protein [Thermoanaerobaculia bacterium]|nr:prepilin-type N-terminal cleavage/methylation domain-containing protein [Thermoanaerobaculia bacterium]
MKTNRQRGFTLIELLIVVAIIGILAAIAIPNLMIALQRAKQKRTMADIRAIALAWEARETDTNSYLAAGTGFTWPSVAVSYPNLATLLSPTYIKEMRQHDGWAHEMGFAVAADASEYAIRSPGKDGNFDSSYPASSTRHFDCDIVYSNGAFIVFPDGVPITK